MIKSFRDKETAALFLGERVRRIPPAIRQVARRKLMQLEQAARSLSDLGARSEPVGERGHFPDRLRRIAVAI